MRVVDSLNRALYNLLLEDPNVYVIGEDILDPYGGAFKVTRGLSSQFPDRVLTTPISEACIVGLGVGMAMYGKRPFVEIMFGDFLTLAMDQILNHAVKFSWTYNSQVEVPLVIRTPMGGRRGYGPTHSQSIEKHFLGIPGLTVYAVNQYTDPGALLRRAYDLGSPCLVIENKVLYARQLDTLPIYDRPDAVLITYGGCVEHAVQAAKYLEDEEELAVRVVALTRLSPFPADKVIKATENVDKVLVVEEGTVGWNLASECARHLIGRPIQFRSLAAPAHPIPASLRWEEKVLPGSHHLVEAILSFFQQCIVRIQSSGTTSHYYPTAKSQ